MDVKTLSATIGHVSSATTLDIYSHITDTMQRQAAVHIDRKIGGTDAQMPTIAREERKDTSPVEFAPYKPKIRKPGTGCVTMINDHLYEGRYTPTQRLRQAGKPQYLRENARGMRRKARGNDCRGQGANQGGKRQNDRVTEKVTLSKFEMQ